LSNCDQWALDNRIDFIAARRWPDGVVTCPRCGAEGAEYVPDRRVWQCKQQHPNVEFSIKVGTIFEDSAISLDKWLIAVWMVANSRDYVSSRQIMRTVGVTEKSALHMLRRISRVVKDRKVGGVDMFDREGSEVHAQLIEQFQKRICSDVRFGRPTSV
jgi:transposase-like protein